MIVYDIWSKIIICIHWSRFTSIISKDTNPYKQEKRKQGITLVGQCINGLYLINSLTDYNISWSDASFPCLAWSGALLTQDEALSLVGLAFTLDVAFFTTLYILFLSFFLGVHAGFFLFYSFNSFYYRLILIFSHPVASFYLPEIRDFFIS